MSREHWKDWLEGIGFLAIIASLIFVGIETRNSTQQARLTTQAIQISSYQELMDNIAELNASVVQDAEVAAFLFKAYATSEELTRVEEFRLSRNLFQRFRHGDIAYFQYQRGVIDDDYPDAIFKTFSVKGKEIELPDGIDKILDRSKELVTAEQDYDKLVEIKFEKNKITCTGTGTIGEYVERIKVDYDEDEMTILAPPVLLMDIVKTNRKITTDGSRLLFKIPGLEHVILLGEQE